MRQYRNMILDPEAIGKFQHVVDDFLGRWSTLLCRTILTRLDSSERPTSYKAPRNIASTLETQILPYPRKAPKRRHPGLHQMMDQRTFFMTCSKGDERGPGRGQRKVPLLVCDIKAQRMWFDEAFRAVQQVGCRTIAKVWIKKIHPKKVGTADVCLLGFVG
jgi:hypothetical protein